MKELKIIKIISDIMVQYTTGDISEKSALSAINEVIEKYYMENLNVFIN